jgi:REP element-mobilizing transposase RayT
MSRPLRLHAPELLHHLFARGNNKGGIFEDDEDYATFLDLLAIAAARFNVHCAAYCLLRNHYHLVLVPHQHKLSRLMQQLNSVYSQRFNHRHSRVGHVLQGRFGCRIVQDGAYARAVFRYVALNPVAAGLVQKPEAWRWSSYGAALGTTPAEDFLVMNHLWRAFGTSDEGIGRGRFATFVAAGLLEPPDSSLLHGSDDLSGRLASALKPHASNVDFVYAHRFAARPSIGTLLEACPDQCSLEEAARTAFFHHGYTLAELGRAVSRDPSTVCRWVRRAAARHNGDAHAGLSSIVDDHARNKI